MDSKSLRIDLNACQFARLSQSAQARMKQSGLKAAPVPVSVGSGAEMATPS